MKCQRCEYLIQPGLLSCLRCGAPVIDSNCNIERQRPNELDENARKRSQQPNIIGIDLGTTYSAVAHLTADGCAEIIRDSDGNNRIPSMVFIEGDNQILVGWEAKRESVVQPDQVAEFFKRKMGTREKMVIGHHHPNNGI